MMYTLPLRRTSWLARWRVRKDFNELRTFIGGFPKNNRPSEPVGTKVRRMPHSRAAINPKDECPEHMLPPPAGSSVPKAAWRFGSPSFVIAGAKSPSPREDHALGRRERRDRALFAYRFGWAVPR